MKIGQPLIHIKLTLPHQRDDKDDGKGISSGLLVLEMTQSPMALHCFLPVAISSPAVGTSSAC